MSDVPRYSVEVSWSDEDELFVAVVPELPGCSAVGHSRSSATQEAEHAIALWLETARAEGKTIPPPSKLEPTSYSGRTVVRMPTSLHRELAQRAKAEGSSLNQYMLYALARYVGTAAAIENLPAVKPGVYVNAKSVSHSLIPVYSVIRSPDTLLTIYTDPPLAPLKVGADLSQTINVDEPSSYVTGESAFERISH